MILSQNKIMQATLFALKRILKLTNYNNISKKRVSKGFNFVGYELFKFSFAT